MSPVETPPATAVTEAAIAEATVRDSSLTREISAGGGFLSPEEAELAVATGSTQRLTVIIDCGFECSFNAREDGSQP